MTSRRIAIAGATTIAAFVLFWFVRNSRAAKPTPAYRVVEKDGRFELREYPALVLVTGRMQPSGEMNSTFGRLFGFISGENDRREKSP